MRLTESRRIRQRDTAGRAGLDAQAHALAHPNTVEEIERKVRGHGTRLVGTAFVVDGDVLERRRQKNVQRGLEVVRCVGGERDLLHAGALRRFRGTARLGLLGLLRTTAACRGDQRRFRGRSILNRRRDGLSAAPATGQHQQQAASVDQEVAGNKSHALIIRRRQGKSQSVSRAAPATPTRAPLQACRRKCRMGAACRRSLHSSRRFFLARPAP
jgi:hypothetical protein